MKGKILVFFVIVLSLLTSCAVENEEVMINEKVKPVKVIDIREESRPLTLEYIGVVQSDEMKEMAFKSSGRIEKIFVSKDKEIKKGDTLVKLDTEDLEYALDASKAGMESAKAQYEKALNGASEEEINQAKANVKKAQDAYDFSQNNYTKTKQLFDEGAVSQSSLDSAKLDLDIRETELNQAKEAEKQVLNSVREEDLKALKYKFEQAEADYGHKKASVENAIILSNVDGYIVDILYEEGEMVSAGYPVIVIRNKSKVVKVGLSQQDSTKVKLEDKVIIKIDEKEVVGKIITIGQIPNSETRTYAAEVALDSDDEFQLGTIVKLELIIGEEKGIWIPITSILTNGRDYVFTVRADEVEKKMIDIEEVVGTKVKVKGLSNDDILVIEGMKKLKDGDKILIHE